MNCYECVSKKVCFLQKSIESLAKQATDNPFYHKVDISADRTPAMAKHHEQREERRYNLECKLKVAIASNCPLYADKTQKQEITNV